MGHTTSWTRWAWVGLAVAALALAGCTVNMDKPASSGRSISVSGEAEVRVVPDEVILTLGVETSNMDLEEAKAENDQRVAAVLDLTERYGIEPKLVQIDHISIEPRYRDSYEKQSFLGYFVRKTVVVTLRDISQFEALLSDVLASGANYVHGIQFRTTELRKHRDEARALAITAAREKAEALAGDLGQEIGEPLKITEGQASWWSGYGSWWGSAYASGMTQNVIQNAAGSGYTGDDTLAPGQIKVTAVVAVEFALR